MNISGGDSGGERETPGFEIGEDPFADKVATALVSQMTVASLTRDGNAFTVGLSLAITKIEKENERAYCLLA